MPFSFSGTFSRSQQSQAYIRPSSPKETVMSSLATTVLLIEVGVIALAALVGLLRK